MTNTLLVHSSCFLVVAHACFLCCMRYHNNDVPWLLRCSYVAGPLTSVWNHCTTSLWARWIDRGVMMLGFAVDVYFICILFASSPVMHVVVWTGALLSLVGAVCSYTVAKQTEDRALHVLAHAWIALAHGSLLLSLYKKNNLGEILY
jgi:hypothetical protein